MKKIILVAAILSSLVAYSAFAEQSMNESMRNNKAAGQDVMYHINPMPNFMKVIMMHGDELDLSEEQQANQAAWREKTRPLMSNLKSMTRMVQLTERVLSSRLPIVEIKHTAKAFTTLNWLIR